MYYLYVTNKNAQVTSLELTYELTSNTPSPSIAAENVDIAYNATGGSIAYTINNVIDGGSVSADVTQGDWLALSNETTSPISFTCEANTSATARTATVTLTYTYGEETVTKNVIVTQAAAPVVYTTIPALFEAATSEETDVNVTFNNWVVSGVSTNGKNVFVTDNNGNGFVIYYNSDMSSTYSAGNILSGTAVPCKLMKYNGFAELLNVNAENLTITEGGTVAVSNIAMADLSGVNTGALVSYEGLECSVNNNKYYLSDGTTTLQVFNSLYTFGALEDGKQYNITGIYQQYYNTKEILPRSAEDIEEIVIPVITVTPSTVNVDAAGGEDTLPISFENLDITGITDFVIQYCDAQGQEVENNPDWIDVEVIDEQYDNYVVSYSIAANEGEARTAYFKVIAIGNEGWIYSNIVTITQAAAPGIVDDYELFTGDLVEGDYLIVYDGKAMNTTVTSDRLQYAEVTATDDVITTDDATIVWHIAPSGEYWTIYNADADAYAASTGAKNKAQMLADGTDNKALWTVSGTETYEFVNKQNAANSVNANLRNNGDYGFACYATSTGGELSLYKKVEATPEYVTVDISSAGMATLSSNKALDFTKVTTIQAYYATLDNSGNVAYHRICKVPAETGLLIRNAAGEAQGAVSADVPTLTETAESVEGNILVAALEAITGLQNQSDGYKNYILNKHSQYGLGFYLANGMNLAANRAFMRIPVQTAREFIGINFDGDATGIESIRLNGTDDAIYDLQGRKVMNPAKGLYIVNGKKVVVK